jgi:hypothetical protein
MVAAVPVQATSASKDQEPALQVAEVQALKVQV